MFIFRNIKCGRFFCPSLYFIRRGVAVTAPILGKKTWSTKPHKKHHSYSSHGHNFVALPPQENLVRKCLVVCICYISMSHCAYATSACHTVHMLHQHVTLCMCYISMSHCAHATSACHTVHVLHQHVTLCICYISMSHCACATSACHTVHVLHQHVTLCMCYISMSHCAYATSACHTGENKDKTSKTDKAVKIANSIVDKIFNTIMRKS